ncbi:class I SAM-dependent methyltransferase [Halobacillus litoralis]|uniref:class I SAM-dependent methyltransferase n=1 Tax=Halobacillus litoralis TaxID=45668 RepID=UPI001CD5FDF3|nr:class I SAM-dependent methyltransferase [Halobacillus litoralis]MCA0970239.1 class I SAM-dependent methyltransferase [Halobacillus litoralis]
MKEYGNELFKGAAPYYAKYRPVYPSSLIRAVVKRFSLDGSQHLLDIGCGTGQLTVRFAGWCERITAIDQDSGMIKEAVRIHNELRTGKIDWQQETLSSYLSQNKDQLFDLVLMAKSFHWMDRQETLNQLYPHIRRGGGVMVVGTIQSSEEPDLWKEAFNQIVKNWYGSERKAGITTYSHPVKGHAQVIEESHFELERHTFSDFNIDWTIESLLGHLYSTSYGLRSFLGESVDDFEKEVEEALLTYDPGGIFQEKWTVTLHIGVKT